MGECELWTFALHTNKLVVTRCESLIPFPPIPDERHEDREEH